eukprot:1137934-Karenia_brevis.AAC.1
MDRLTMLDTKVGIATSSHTPPTERHDLRDLVDLATFDRIQHIKEVKAQSASVDSREARGRSASSGQ